MKDILHKLLNKRGLTIDALDKEEKEQFNSWQATLTKDELSTEDIKDFCRRQLDLIEAKWSNLDLEQVKKAELIPYHTIYSLLLKVIDSPKEARDALEKNLTQLL